MVGQPVTVSRRVRSPDDLCRGFLGSDRALPQWARSTLAVLARFAAATRRGAGLGNRGRRAPMAIKALPTSAAAGDGLEMGSSHDCGERQPKTDFELLIE